MFYCREYLKKIYATDVPEIYGNSVIVAVEVLAETGTDLSKWATEKNLLGGWTSVLIERYRKVNSKQQGIKKETLFKLRGIPNGSKQLKSKQ